ncbi:hypothetical protein BC941DRAFT_372579 [Chlamydoabsidia padenii]|nr:hypothetical protein BC941DRAFT_372579 [Chlamydoabsidia padenii]
MTIHSQLKLEPCLARLGIMPEDKPSFIKEVYAVEDIDTLRKLLIDKERERQSVANDLDVAARLGLVISETNEAIQIKLAHLERENQELQDALVYAHDSFHSTNNYNNSNNNNSSNSNSSSNSNNHIYTHNEHRDFEEDERQQLTDELNQARRELTKFRNEMDGLSGQLNDMASEMVDSRARVSLYAKRLAEVEHKLTTTREMNTNLQALLEKALTSQKQSSSTTSHLVKNIQSDLIRVVTENDQLRTRIAELEHQQMECEERLSTMVAQAKEYASLLEQAQNTIHSLSEPRLDDDDLLSNDLSSISLSSSNWDGNHSGKESEVTKGAVFSVEFRQEMQKEIERNLNIRNEIRHRIITADNTNIAADKKNTAQQGLKSLLADQEEIGSTISTSRFPMSVNSNGINILGSSPSSSSLSSLSSSPSPANPMNTLRPVNFLTGFSGFANDHNNSIGLNGINNNNFMTRGRFTSSPSSIVHQPRYYEQNNNGPSISNSRQSQSNQQHPTYKSTPLSLQRNAAASPTRITTSTGITSSPPITFSRQTPLPTQTSPWSSDDDRKKTNGDHHTLQQELVMVEYLDTISLDDIMTTDPQQYVNLVITTYKTSEQFIFLKEKSKTPYLFQHLADYLLRCEDPCTWIQSVLLELGDYFTANRKLNRNLTPKFQRLLVQAICRGLDLYLNPIEDLGGPDIISPQQKMQQDQQLQEQKQQNDNQQQCDQVVPDLIVFTDDEDEESDLIDLTFDSENDEGVDNGNGGNGGEDEGDDSDDDDDDDDDDTDDDDVVILDMSAINTQLSRGLKISTIDTEDDTNDGSDMDENTGEKETGDNMTTSSKSTYSTNTQLSTALSTPRPQHPLTKEHQIAFINMIDKTDSPSVVYYAIETFRVTHLLVVGADYESYGTTLCRQLLRQEFYKEAISCILRLHQQEHFPMTQMAEYLFNVGQGAMLLEYVNGKIGLQYSLLSFINIQLRYNFAGILGVVDADLLANVEKDAELVPPMQRMRERRFQKELLTYGQKLVDKLDLPLDNYYFIWLSQRYAAIRWAVSARSAQQSGEGDYSIDASSNYNGILELIVDNTPTLAKLVIKELVDLQDIIGAQYFATLFKQEHFCDTYQSLSPNQRMLGVIRGEQISHSLSSYHLKKQQRNNNEHLINYVLPVGVHYRMVDDHVGILEMKLSLVQSQRCGLDSEWVPTMAKAGKEKTALLQLATDDGMVYLLDMKTLLKPMNHQLLARAERVLRNLFESKDCVKLAYDFSGDMSLLIQCMPDAKNWKTKNFKDMNKIKDKKGNHISGGLAGVVSTFLGVAMNKKQQLSNWEKRPLTTEQARYAACDAYCLLEVYDILAEQGNEFATETIAPPPPLIKSSPSKFSHLDSPVSSLELSPGSPLIDIVPSSRRDVSEPSSSHAALDSLDLIHF